MSAVFRFIMLTPCWLLSAMALAQAVVTDDVVGGQSAHAIVNDATRNVMVVVNAARDYADEDPERYYQAVHDVLDPVIDYRGFARSVMGPYGSSERYRSLDEAGREQLRRQLDEFTEVMRVGLVRTYGKGLLAFSGSRIELDGPEENDSSQTRVSVRQLIYAEDIQPHVVMYQMGKGSDGQWQLRNVIIETVNLGEIYRNQFQSAARKHKGDLDDVIKTWSAVELDT